MEAVVGPGKYIRRAEILSEVGQYGKQFGTKALLIGGHTALSVTAEKVVASLAEQGIEAGAPFWYGGESSWTNIDRLAAEVEQRKPDMLIAIGGGKVMDTVKAAAYRVGLPVIAIPTIAATCAATTSIAIIYDDHGTFTEISRRSKAPELVLVDTAVISKAPVRFLIAGIGDTLAKWFESRATSQKAVPSARVKSAVGLAKVVYELLLESGKEAVSALEQGQVTPVLEDVIDAIILLSGSVSGYGGDDCRTAAAHAIYSGLTIFPEIHETYHGEIVAFGILAQLALEGRKEQEIRELISYYRQVRLPASLPEMGVRPLTAEDWQRLGEVTVTIEDMANMPFAVSPQMVIDAVQKADELGRAQQ
ncbi:iron-containing alcohol dehydrogenase family protein [Brevibacillus sp. B_LB10_24]|uniref:iron-containing alcohol dehydrogenase family protein n=1 Tax=Brevibacillus sp. B_LB10_24 TaxID=3380645 RepID=UPI0038B945D8